nr:MAG TPA: acetylxylan esterase related enzyme [Crassvirales sp.]
MKQFSKDLGNVSIVPKGKWSREQEYERLALVYNACDNLSYIAKIDVPSGVDIENREYWQPMNATGYADNNFINLTTENENGTITAYETLEEAVATILPINRRAGATLSFYNLNSDRLDRQAEFELWQFNSTDLANWENRDYWNNVYYNWNVFVGWYIGADALKNHVKIPTVGQYAYVGSNLNDAILYQCRTNGTWTNTGTKVRNYISVVVGGNITIGDNGNWFSDGKDTGIPATPAVDEQLDNIGLQLQQHNTEIDKLQRQDVALKSNIDSNFETINNKVDNIKTDTDNKIDSADANLQKQITGNDNDIATLNTKHESLSKTVKGIAATGGASTATNVTYNKTNSGLNAENAQDAIDELQGSKVNKTAISQEFGGSEDNIMSQKVVTNSINNLFPYGNYKKGTDTWYNENLTKEGVSTYKCYKKENVQQKINYSVKNITPANQKLFVVFCIDNIELIGDSEILLYIYNRMVTTINASNINNKIYYGEAILSQNDSILPQVMFYNYSKLNVGDYVGKFTINWCFVIPYPNITNNLSLSSVIHSIKANNAVNAEKAAYAEKANNAVNVSYLSRFLRSVNLKEVNISNKNEGSVIDSENNLITLYKGSERLQIDFPSNVEIGKDYIFTINISGSEFYKNYYFILDVYNYNKKIGSIHKEGFHVIKFTATSTNIMQILFNNLKPVTSDESNLVSKFYCNLISVTPYSENILNALNVIKNNIRSDISPFLSNIISLSYFDYSKYFYSERLNVLADKKYNKFSTLVTDWNNITGRYDISFNKDNTVCTGSIPKDNTGRFSYWGVHLSTDLVKKSVIVYKGSIRGTNISKVELGNVKNTLLAQDVIDNVEIAVKGILTLSLEDLKYNGIYNGIHCTPKDISISACTFTYKADYFFVCEEIEGYNIDDYINLYNQTDKSKYIIKNIPTSLASKDYVDEKVKAVEIKPKHSQLYFDSDINMLINYGQSLSVGGLIDKYAGNFYKTLVFKGGGNEWSSNVNINSEESVNDFYGTDLYVLEDTNKRVGTPVGCNALSWMKLLTDENDIDLNNFEYQFILSTPGLSGAPIEYFIKNTNTYNRLLLSVRKGKELSNKLNKTFSVPVLFWVQGEGNTPGNVDESLHKTKEQDYYNKLKQMFVDLNSDIKSITGQTNDVVFITYQMAPVIGVNFSGNKYNYSGPSWAHLKLALNENNVYLGGAMYQYDYGTDIWHPLNREVVGLQAGIIAKKIINDKKPYPIFYMKSHWIQQNEDKYILSILFDVPVSPMRFDISGDEFHNINGKQINYGFTLKNNEGVDIIAEEPTISRGNTLNIICNENPLNCKLSYAINGHFGGGNLCDSQNFKISVSNKIYTIDNFCPAFIDYVID